MKRLRFLLIIPLFLCFALIYLIGNSFLRRDEPLVHSYIPDEVDVLIEFDIKHFGSVFLYNMLYNSEYFNEKIPMPKMDDKKDLPNMGISVTSNFVFALERWGEGNFYYFIFELNSKKEFDEFMTKLSEDNNDIVAVSNSEIGIFGFTYNVDNKIAKEYLGEVVNRNIENIKTKYNLEEHFNSDRDVNIHLNTNSFIKSSKLKDVFASFDLVSSSVILDVEYNSNREYNVHPIEGKVLKSKNLHISSTMKFSDIFATFGLHNIEALSTMPKIKKWSFNNLGSQLEMVTGISQDSINEIYSFRASKQNFTIDSKGKFGVYLPSQKMKIAFNTEEKFEILMEPENRKEFEAYFRSLIDSNFISMDTSSSTISLGQLGTHNYTWIEGNFIIFPKNEKGVELVEIHQQGSYFYMNFDINPFFENITMEGDGTFFANAGAGVFNGFVKKYKNTLSKFKSLEVSLTQEQEKIKIHFDLDFKNTQGVAAIEMMSAFIKRNL